MAERKEAITADAHEKGRVSGERFDLEARQLHIAQLVTLSVVGKYLSFTRSAESLGVSQPSVSQQIRDLERVCSAPLVLQQGRNLKLMPLGEDLAPIGDHIALDRERAVRSIVAHHAGEAGRIIAAASMTTGVYVLPRAIARYGSTHPHVRVDVRIANTFDVAEMVWEDIADVGVVEGPVTREELVVTPFATDQIRCFTSPRGPLARKSSLQAADFATATLLVREEGSGTREVVLAALEDAGIRFGRLMLFGTIEAIKRAVTEGLGVAWLPIVAVQAELKANTLLQLHVENVVVERRFSIVRRRDTAPSAATKAFIETLLSLER
jgi:LysR family transcriptional regulator, transcriptional activator of the cysJI operon